MNNLDYPIKVLEDRKDELRDALDVAKASENFVLTLEFENKIDSINRVLDYLEAAQVLHNLGKSLFK